MISNRSTMSSSASWNKVVAEVHGIAKGDLVIAPFVFCEGTCTGHHAAASAGVKSGDVVAVVGD
jgi:hypothetical protein